MPESATSIRALIKAVCRAPILKPLILAGAATSHVDVHDQAAQPCFHVSRASIEASRRFCQGLQTTRRRKLLPHAPNPAQEPVSSFFLRTISVHSPTQLLIARQRTVYEGEGNLDCECAAVLTTGIPQLRQNTGILQRRRRDRV